MGDLYRHKKRGTLYILIGMGKIQSDSWTELSEFDDVNQCYHDLSVDMREVVIYCSATDHSEIWVRPREEFEDGRFELIPE